MDTEVLYVGKHLTLKKSQHWEYVTRNRVTGIVGIVAVTSEQELILVEQLRIPVDKKVIELPAGLAGDVVGQEDEPLEEAARRELFEETGYETGKLTRLIEGTSSAGLTTETTTLFLAEELNKTGTGGGDETEQITVHLVPLNQTVSWLTDRVKEGAMIDFKVYAGLYCIGQMLINNS